MKNGAIPPISGRVIASPFRASRPTSELSGLLAAVSWNPINPDEVWPAEGVVLVRMDHRPRQVRWADEALSVAEGHPERDQWATALIGRDRPAVYVHGQTGHPGRERNDQVVVASLAPVIMFGLGPL